MRLSNPLAHLNEGINVPFFGYIEFKVGKEMSKAKRTLHDFCEKVITEKEQVMNADEVIEKLSDKRKGEMDLLSLFMAVRDERGQRLSKTQLRDVLLNLIIAGRCVAASFFLPSPRAQFQVSDGRRSLGLFLQRHDCSSLVMVLLPSHQESEVDGPDQARDRARTWLRRPSDLRQLQGIQCFPTGSSLRKISADTLHRM